MRKKKRWLKKLTLHAYYFVKTSNNNNDNINNQVEVQVHILLHYLHCKFTDINENSNRFS